ncbi:MAG TPA: DNA polymerase III subunit beta [Oscillospiraceae bacterium]|nr:DNA polymerase III subunit beta [Oscillospiraceae bacterium]HXK77199.1 DNA polymerase III subunit beta [Oscillospiraceae bacterium]
MKIICNRNDLSEALNNVTRAVATKSTHPAMEGVLVRAEEGAISLVCYNMEMGIRTSMEAKVAEEGAIVLNARLFFDIVRRLSSETIEITCDERFQTEVRGGAAEYRIIGIDAGEFPELPEVDGSASITFKQDTLKSMIDQTIFAVAVNDFKPVHTGSKFIFENGEATLVSVDGFRLAIRKEPTDYPDELSFIVPGKTLGEVSKLLGGEGDVTLELSGKHIVFLIGGYSVISRLLEGDFIDFRSSIPQTSATVVTVGVRELLESIERTSLLISERLKSPIRLSVLKDEIRLSCATALGRVNDTVSCEMQGEEVEMGFNNRYLLEALRATGCDKVRLVINSPLSPVKILPMEGDSFLFLVLPVRMKSEM